MPEHANSMNPSDVTRAGARSQDRARPGLDPAMLREKLAEAVTHLLNLMDAIDGDSDYESEPLELADDSTESDEPVRDPVLFFIGLERALREVR